MKSRLVTTLFQIMRKPVNKDVIILAKAPPEWPFLCIVSLSPSRNGVPLHQRYIYTAERKQTRADV